MAEVNSNEGQEERPRLQVRPGWVVLTAAGTGKATYVDARRIVAIESPLEPDVDGPTGVHVGEIGKVLQVAETTEEVMHKLGGATA